MHDVYDLFLVFPVILLMFHWWNTSEQKRVALAAARDYCKQRKLQLLDDSLVFRKYRVERDMRRKRRLCRVYEFDYCPDGMDRHTGEIVLTGMRVMRVVVHSDVLEITQY